MYDVVDYVVNGTKIGVNLFGVFVWLMDQLTHSGSSVINKKRILELVSGFFANGIGKDADYIFK